MIVLTSQVNSDQLLVTDYDKMVRKSKHICASIYWVLLLDCQLVEIIDYEKFVIVDSKKLIVVQGIKRIYV